MLVLLTGIQNHRGEVRAVWRVGEVLSLEADCAAAGERSTMNTLVASGEVSGVELHAGLGGVALQGAAALGLGNSGSKTELALFLLIQYVVVVETMTELDLLVISFDILAESLRCAEVERSAGYLQDFTRRNSGVVGGQIEVGIDLANLILDSGSGVGDASQ